MSNRKTCLDNPVIADHPKGIHALCRDFGVLRPEAFCSVCTPDSDPERSDVEFLVEYPTGNDFRHWLTQ